MANQAGVNAVRVSPGTVFPEGTVVNAYLAREIPTGHNGSPMGNIIATATVTDGELHFKNRASPGAPVTGELVDGESYIAFGQVDGVWRSLSFAMKPQKILGARENPEGVGTVLVEGHNFELGYNPSVDLNPDNPSRWSALTFVVVVDRAGGNRVHTRAMNLVGIDPAELVFRGFGPDNTIFGPNEDGTELIGAIMGQGLGRFAWQGQIPQGSYQGWNAHVGVHAAEDVRRDSLTVTLTSEVTLPQSTIEVTGDMGAVVANDATHAFMSAGTVTISGKTITYAGRDANTLFGCTNAVADNGTVLAASATVQQIRVANAGRMHFHTTSRGTNDRANRIRVNDDGSIAFGEEAILRNDRGFFIFRGGQTQFKSISQPTNFAATVVGTPGSASITYKLVGNTAEGGQTSPISVTIADAPDTLSDSNYVRLSWDTSRGGMHSWDVVRESTTGLPADTGALVYRRPHYEKNLATDRGQVLAAVNEEQSILVRNATGGTFRLGFDGGETNPIDYNATAADVQAKLEAVGTIGAGNVTVTKEGATAWKAVFTGALGGTDVSQLVPRLPLELVNEPETDEEVEEGEEPEDFPAPSVIIRTRVIGGPVAYTLPTRNTTADVAVEGQLTVSQMMKLPELSADPAAPATNEALIYAKDNGSGKTGIYARFATGAVQQIAIQP